MSFYSRLSTDFAFSPIAGSPGEEGGQKCLAVFLKPMFKESVRVLKGGGGEGSWSASERMSFRSRLVHRLGRRGKLRADDRRYDANGEGGGGNLDDARGWVRV